MDHTTVTESMGKHLLSGGQIRAARALLRWSVEGLARHASLGLNTIKRAEAKDGATSLTAANELAIRRAFEAAGVEFTNGDRPGVRLIEAAAALSRGARTLKAAERPSQRKTPKATEKKG
jgi:hypothetical protein